MSLSVLAPVLHVQLTFMDETFGRRIVSLGPQLVAAQPSPYTAVQRVKVSGTGRRLSENGV